MEGNATNLLFGLKQGGGVDFEALTRIDLEGVNSRLLFLDRRLTIVEDLKTLERLPQQLKSWQESESQKKASLIKLGFRGDESREELEARIDELKKGPESKTVTLLSSLKPLELPAKVKKFFDRYRLAITADEQILIKLKSNLEVELKNCDASQFIQEIAARISDPEDPSRWQEEIKKIKAAQIILQLGNLTPQLIAFNRLTVGKKKATLKNGIDYLKRNFRNNEPLLKTLERIESIINEASHPVGKDRLAMIFTDHPLAMLTIGKFPHGATSCQNYENGDSVLAAYMADSYTKMCLLVDLNKLPPEVAQDLEKAEDTNSKIKIFNEHTYAFLSASVGRRLTKIVQSKKENKAKLFLEPVYTPLDRNSTTRLMNAFAVTTLGPKLGVDLVRGGGTDEVFISESRNGSQYEDGEYGGPGGDGGGLGTKRGSYLMPAQSLQQKDYLLSL